MITKENTYLYLGMLFTLSDTIVALVAHKEMKNVDRLITLQEELIEYCLSITQVDI